MRNEPITIYGDGEQTRDFVYIEDVVNTWLSAIDNKRSFGKVFNIGFGRKVSINSLAREVIKSLGLNPPKHPILHDNIRPGEQRFMQGDITLAQRYLDFKPKVNLSRGIRLTIDWAKRESIIMSEK